MLAVAVIEFVVLEAAAVLVTAVAVGVGAPIAEGEIFRFDADDEAVRG